MNKAYAALLNENESIVEMNVSKSGIVVNDVIKTLSIDILKVTNFDKYCTYLKFLLHKSELKIADQVFTEKYIYNKISKNKTIFHIFDLKINGDYVPCIFRTISIGAKDDGSYDVFFVWKRLEDNAIIWEDALKLMTNLYQKIVKVNIVDDTFKEIKLSGESCSEYKKFTDWQRDIAHNSIFSQDVEACYEFMKKVKEAVLSDEDQVQMDIKYRKKSLTGTYRWFITEAVKSKQDGYVILYTRDIHDEVSYQMIADRKMSYYDRHNLATGLLNKRGFEEDLTKISSNEEFGIILMKIKEEYSFDTEITRYIANKMINYFGGRSSYTIDTGIYLVKFDKGEKLFYDLVNNSFCEDISKYCDFAYHYGKDLNQLIRDCYIDIYGEYEGEE